MTTSPLICPSQPSPTTRPCPSTGWQTYPLSLPTFDPLLFDGASLSTQLTALAPTLFRGAGEKIHVSVIDCLTANDGGSVVRTSTFRDEKALEDHWGVRGGRLRTRIVSIAQDYAFSPLNITEEAARKLLTYHEVSPAFLPVLFNCGDQPGISDEGSANVVYEKEGDGSFNLSYQFKYAERNNHRQGNPWSIRQTGVYHHHSASTDSNLFILLHPNPSSKLQSRIEAAVGFPSTASAINENPLKLHTLVLSSYFDNWRWYLKELGDAFSTMADKAMTIDIRERAHYDLSFDTLQNLRHLEEKVIPLGALLKVTWGIVDAIANADRDFQPRLEVPKSEGGSLSSSLASYVSQCRGFVTSEEILQKRIRGILELLSDALNLKNQAVAADINSHLLHLTRDNVDDSATVRVVTLVTLIYLPASFVATIFGMNLFVFNAQTATIRIATDFWIYVAFSIPLTFVTVGYWFLLARKSKQRRNANFGKELLDNEKGPGV